MDTIKAIAARKSVRAYKGEQIADSVLDGILAAGCAAPVGMRAYESLHLSVVQDKDILGKISAAVKQVMNTDTDPLYGAPTLVIIASKAPAAPGLDYVNAGCVAENMMLAATDAGIGSVIIWGSGGVTEASPELKQAVGIPEGFTALFGVALGNSAEPPAEKELKVSLSTSRV